MNFKDEKMAAVPVGRLMLSMGIPMIVSMVLQAVYNIADSAFVSNMPTNGENALNALTLAFPLQVLMVAVGIGTGVGANVLIARSLGQKDIELTNKTVGNAVFLGLVIYAVFLIFGLFGAKTYIDSQTDNSVISAMGTEYLSICCIFSFGMSMFAIFEKVLQAAGHSLCSTAAQILGAITNIVLDPIMIYGWLGCPEMGVRGAAYATVIGQIVSFAAALFFHLKFNRSIRLRLVHFKPSLRTCLHKILHASFRQILPMTASKLLEIRKYSCEVFPCPRQNLLENLRTNLVKTGSENHRYDLFNRTSRNHIAGIDLRYDLRNEFNS